MMERYAHADYRLSGERIVELGWVRAEMQGTKGALVADFGTIVRTRYGPRIGWPSYGLDDTNTVVGYDAGRAPAACGTYVWADLTDPDSLPENHFNVGICVSSLEHFGLDEYEGPHNDRDGDLKGLVNMLGAIKPKGRLLLTVPAGRGIIMNGYIREYSPEQLGALLKQAGVKQSTVRYFWWDHHGGDHTWYEVDRKTLVEKKSKESLTDTVTTGLACIRIIK